MSESPESGTSESILSKIMAATSSVMQAQLSAAQVSFDHNGMRGTSAEEIVAKFLNSHLPISVRAVAGKLIDSNGVRSKQLDVIIYDTTRTPMLFASASETQHLVPTEGAVAVVEVKSHLTKEELRKSSDHCTSVKSLDRSSYLARNLQPVFDLDNESPAAPIYYSIFAFKSDGLYAEALNEEIGIELPVHDQIDSLVCLDRGLCLNGSVSVPAQADPLALQTSFSASPSSESIRMNVEGSNPLVVWYGVVASTILERLPLPPIDITKYLRSELHVSGNVQGAATKKLYDQLINDVASSIDIDPAALSNMSSPARLTPAQLHSLYRHDMYQLNPSITAAEAIAAFATLKQSARVMDTDAWVDRWFPGQDPHAPAGLFK